MSAMAGIDPGSLGYQGKRYGLPAYQLLRQVREQSGLFLDWRRSSRRVTRAAREVRGATGRQDECEQRTALHRYRCVDEIVERVGSVRQAVGRTLGLRSIFMAGRISQWQNYCQALDRFNVFIESGSFRYEAIIEVARHTSTLLLGTPFSRWDFKVFRARRRRCRATGCFACRRHQRDSQDRHHGGSLRCHGAIHCPLGPIALAASLQLNACLRTFYPGTEPRDSLREAANSRLSREPVVFQYRTAM